MDNPFDNLPPDELPGANVTPVPAATIILLREADSGPPEILMLARTARAAFAGGALVFPGGKLAPGDYDVPAARIRNSGALDEALLPFAVAAVRECFEESGILLACDDTGAAVSAERAAALEPWRTPLDRGEATMAAFLESENLVLTLDGFVPLAHWVTPPISPKRYDTRFFIAEAPADQEHAHDGREAIDSLWISAAQALAEGADGRRFLMPPTRRSLELVDEETSIDAVLDATRGRGISTERWGPR